MMSTDTRSPSSSPPSDKASSTELGESLPVQYARSKSRDYIETQWGSIIALSDEQARIAKGMRRTESGTGYGLEVESHSKIESKNAIDSENDSQSLQSGESTLGTSDHPHRHPSYVVRTTCPSKMQQRRAQQMINVQRVENRNKHLTRSRAQIQKDSFYSDNSTLDGHSDHDVNTAVTSSNSGKNYKIGDREMKALLKS
ncbi:hypothetical protein V866_005193 [Kwoniella sp. B9012]